MYECVCVCHKLKASTKVIEHKSCRASCKCDSLRAIDNACQRQLDAQRGNWPWGEGEGGTWNVNSFCQMPKGVHLKVSCCALFPQQKALEMLTIQHTYTYVLYLLNVMIYRTILNSNTTLYCLLEIDTYSDHRQSTSFSSFRQTFLPFLFLSPL